MPTEATYKVIGLHLLFLLSSDRIGMKLHLSVSMYLIAEFHTHLEALSSHEQYNPYIKYPIQLERYVMEGNYAKALAGKRDKVFDVLFQRLQGVVQAKQRLTRTESSTTAGLQSGASLVAIDNAAAVNILSNMIGYATDLERIV